MVSLRIFVNRFWETLFSLVISTHLKNMSVKLDQFPKQGLTKTFETTTTFFCNSLEAKCFLYQMTKKNNGGLENEMVDDF